MESSEAGLEAGLAVHGGSKSAMTQPESGGINITAASCLPSRRERAGTPQHGRIWIPRP